MHVEKQEKRFGRQCQFFSKVPFATPLVSPTAASQAAGEVYADGAKESCVSGFNLHAAISQELTKPNLNTTVGNTQPRRERERLKFEKFPTPAKFSVGC